jgi:hypothetical protein
MITPELITPPAIIAYTHRHWHGYTPACWIKKSPTLSIKLNAGASYTVFGIFDRATIGESPAIASTLARTNDDGATVITTPSDPNARGIICMAIADV